MIPYIYLIMFAGLALIGLAFYFKEFAVGAIASMLLMIVGVYIIANGLIGISNYLTETFGVILIAVSGYILVRGAIEFSQGNA